MIYYQSDKKYPCLLGIWLPPFPGEVKQIALKYIDYERIYADTAFSMKILAFSKEKKICRIISKLLKL